MLKNNQKPNLLDLNIRISGLSSQLAFHTNVTMHSRCLQHFVETCRQHELQEIAYHA